MPPVSVAVLAANVYVTIDEAVTGKVVPVTVTTLVETVALYPLVPTFALIAVATLLTVVPPLPAAEVVPVRISCPSILIELNVVVVVAAETVMVNLVVLVLVMVAERSHLVAAFAAPIRPLTCAHCTLAATVQVPDVTTVQPLPATPVDGAVPHAAGVPLHVIKTLLSVPCKIVVTFVSWEVWLCR